MDAAEPLPNGVDAGHAAWGNAAAWKGYLFEFSAQAGDTSAITEILVHDRGLKSAKPTHPTAQPKKVNKVFERAVEGEMRSLCGANRRLDSCDQRIDRFDEAQVAGGGAVTETVKLERQISEDFTRSPRVEARAEVVSPEILIGLLETVGKLNHALVERYFAVESGAGQRLHSVAPYVIFSPAAQLFRASALSGALRATGCQGKCVMTRARRRRGCPLPRAALASRRGSSAGRPDWRGS